MPEPAPLTFTLTLTRRHAAIQSGLHPSLDDNLNGPSLIRVPPWLPNPLGRYYLYFAHHSGQHLRLAYADSLAGPWRIHAPGVLPYTDTPSHDHVASPDVHLDHARQQILLYYHGTPSPGAPQTTWLARSSDGLHFTSDRTALGPFYFRVFQHDGAHYALAKGVDRGGGGLLLRSPDGVTPFTPGPALLPDMRHAAVWHRGDHLPIAYSRIGDAPERLLLSRLDFHGPWQTWTASAPVELLRPEHPWEGADLPIAPSHVGAAHGPVHQLRDPAFFHDEDGQSYLLYSIAGESALALAALT